MLLTAHKAGVTVQRDRFRPSLLAQFLPEPLEEVMLEDPRLSSDPDTGNALPICLPVPRKWRIVIDQLQSSRREQRPPLRLTRITDVAVRNIGPAHEAGSVGADVNASDKSAAADRHLREGNRPYT